MANFSSSRETAAETTVRNFVLTRAALAIYDPMKARRPRAEVLDFSIELLEFDDEDGVVHAAGPVTLMAPDGPSEHYLRISFPCHFDGDACKVPEEATIRASYVVPTDHPSGACRETAALANA